VRTPPFSSLSKIEERRKENKEKNEKRKENEE